MGLGPESHYPTLWFSQIKDAVALCELFNWLEQEVGSYLR